MSRSESDTSRRGLYKQPVSEKQKQKNKSPVFVKPWGRGALSRVGQCLKRWWWLYLLVITIVVLAVVLPIVFVLYPHLSQQGIDQTTVTVQGIGLSDPTPTDYRFSLNTTLYPETKFKVDLDPFNVSLYLTDVDMETPFTTVLFPHVHVDGVTTVNITNQLVTIDNPDIWQKYLAVAFSNSSYRVTTIGQTQLHLGILPRNEVYYNKTVEIAGYGGLRGIETTDMTVVLGQVFYDFLATAVIVNPSPSTVFAGNITYDTYLAPNETFIGKTFLTDVVIEPGKNLFPFKSSTSQIPVVKVLGTYPYCRWGVITVKIVPVNVTYDGVPIDWLLPTLTNVTQVLPIAEAIETATNGSFSYACPPGTEWDGMPERRDSMFEAYL